MTLLLNDKVKGRCDSNSVIYELSLISLSVLVTVVILMIFLSSGSGAEIVTVDDDGNAVRLRYQPGDDLGAAHIEKVVTQQDEIDAADPQSSQSRPSRLRVLHTEARRFQRFSLAARDGRVALDDQDAVAIDHSEHSVPAVI